MTKKLNLMQFLWIPFFLTVSFVCAQSRNIGIPELTNNSSNQICVIPTSGGFTLISTLSPGTAFAPENQFILQLSDPDGSFNDPNDVQDIGFVDDLNGASGSLQEIIFDNILIPEEANSDFYKLRVISSTVDGLMSAETENFAVHFFEDNLDRISLNNNNDVFICDGSSFSTTISITLLDLDDNVVDPDEYVWEWLKDDSVILGESDSSLTISATGRYFARLPFGDCNNTFRFNESNKIDVIVIDISEVFISTPAVDFSYCPDEEKILSTSFNDLSFDYLWYKNGVLLEEFTTATITLPDNDFGGDYEVEIVFSAECTLKSEPPVTVTNEGSSITIPLPEQLIKLPTQDNLTLEITTDAPIGSPIRWIVDTSIQSAGIVDGPISSFVASFFATYRVEIDANDPCDSRLFSETEVLAPTGFNLLIGTQDDVTCDQDVITLELLEMTGSTVKGDVPLTEDQLTFFDFEWFNDGVATGDIGISLDLNRTGAEGSYELVASLRDNTEFINIASNNLPIVFLDTDIVLEVSPEFLPVDGSVTLTAPLSTDFSYEWYVVINGEEVPIEGETGNTLTVSEEGDYFARITSSLCEVDTLIAEVRVEAAASGLIPNVITPGGNSANDDWVLPALYNESDVEITIYSSNGKVDFEKSGGYSSEWPSDSVSNAQEMLYYYIIKKNNAFVRKGTITVIR